MFENVKSKARTGVCKYLGAVNYSAQKCRCIWASTGREDWIVSVQRYFFLLLIISCIIGYFIWVFVPVDNYTVIGKHFQAPIHRYCYLANNSTILFIHLTNETNRWLPLEMCAIKSAAIMNTGVGVCVLTLYPIRRHPALSDLPNLEIARLNIRRVFKNTPLQELYESGAVNSSDQYFIAHLSDALRYAYLYKYGGRYIDTDALTLRGLGDLINVMGWQDEGLIANGVLFFHRKHPFLIDLLYLFKGAYVPGEWDCVGPRLVTDVHRLGVVENSTYSVREPETFYPVHFLEHHLPYNPEQREFVKQRVTESYSLHLYRQMWVWNQSVHTFIDPPPGSFVYDFLHDVCLEDMIIYD